MSKQKYYSVTNIKRKNADYNLLLGERSNGKSYAVKEEVLINAWNDDCMRFIYCRRWELDVKPAKCEKYFEDMNIMKITGNECNCITSFKGMLFFSYNDGESIKRVKQCGDVMYLSGYVHYKSMSYPKTSDLIFEEFIPEDGVYLGDDEPDKLMSLISTIARRRRIRVWLIANVISRMCPYFGEWQLKNIPKQKQGTIDIYKIETTQREDNGDPVIVTIAVEFCENSGQNSKMFFGARSEMITSGAWQCKPSPHLPDKYKHYNVVYGINVIYGDLKYNMELLYHSTENYFIIYVYPAIKIKYKRIIQKQINGSVMITDRLYPITCGDKMLLSYVKLNKIAYSDNLTGSEFDDIIDKIL